VENKKAGDGAALMCIKRGSYEKPNLVEDDRRGRHDADVNAERVMRFEDAKPGGVNELD